MATFNLTVGVIPLFFWEPCRLMSVDMYQQSECLETARLLFRVPNNLSPSLYGQVTFSSPPSPSGLSVITGSPFSHPKNQMIPQNCPPPCQVILTGHLDPLVSDWSVWHNGSHSTCLLCNGEGTCQKFWKEPLRGTCNKILFHGRDLHFRNQLCYEDDDNLFTSNWGICAIPIEVTSPDEALVVCLFRAPQNSVVNSA